MKNWTLVRDADIRHYYNCTGWNLQDHPKWTCVVYPDFFEQAGTPVCPHCGEDAVYDHTEVYMEDSNTND